MVKRYSNAAGVSHLCETVDPETRKPKGDYVEAKDYDALQNALGEALGSWKWFVSIHDERTLKRITELRKQFLED